MRNLWIGIEYPVNDQHYPGIWVDYEDTGNVQIAGIGHHEYYVTELTYTRATRYRFAGYASFTVVALSSLERDRMYDELVRTFAFYGSDDDQINEFRLAIEDNEYIAMNMDFDQIETRGNAASPGTPWGTDEIIYERTINMELIGEFVSSGATRQLVKLEHFIIHPEAKSPDGTFEDPYPDYPGSTPGDGDPTTWH